MSSLENRKHSPRTRITGLTSIEFALALPVLAFFIVGAVDITRTMKAYSTLQEAVDKTVRCSHTTDGDCVQTAPSNYTAFYSWFQVSSAPSFPVDLQDYRAEATWLRRPSTSFAARIPTSVHYTLSPLNFDAKRWAFGGAANLRTIIRGDSGPYLDGDNPRSPSFVYLNNPAATFPITASFSPNGDAHISSNGAESNDIVRIPISASIEGAPTPITNQIFSTPCFKASPVDFDRPRAINSETPRSDFGAGDSCGPAWQNSEITAVIHVRGRATGAGVGQLILELHKRTEPPGTWISLGGQDFSGPGLETNGAPKTEPNNFFPRGALNWNTTLLNQQEFSAYRLAVKIPIMADGSPGAVVRVSRAPNWPTSLRYVVENVDVRQFGYRYYDVPVPCLNSVGAGDLAAQPNFSTCESTYPISAPLTNVAWNTQVNVDPLPSVTLGCQASEAAARQALNVPDAQNYIFTATANGTCSGVNGTLSAACPGLGQPGPTGQLNLGVPESADPQGKIVNSARAMEICPPPPSPAGQPAATVAYWQEQTVALPAGPQNPWSPANCSAVRPDLSAYSKIVETTTTTDFYPEGPGNPTLNPAYNCGYFQVVRRVLDDPQHGGDVVIPETSLFSGARPEMTTSCRDDALRHEAHSLGIPEGAYLEFASSYATTEVCTPNEQGRTANCQTGSCFVYRVKNSSSNPRTAVAGGPLPEGQTPAACNPALNPGVSCVREFDHFVGNRGTSVVAGAEAYAFAHIEALYPSARRGCSDADCFSVAVATDDASVSVNAEAHVQMMLLGGSPLRLTYHQQREKEKSFAR